MAGATHRRRNTARRARQSAPLGRRRQPTGPHARSLAAVLRPSHPRRAPQNADVHQHTAVVQRPRPQHRPALQPRLCELHRRQQPHPHHHRLHARQHHQRAARAGRPEARRRPARRIQPEPSLPLHPLGHAHDPLLQRVAVLHPTAPDARRLHTLVPHGHHAELRQSARPGGRQPERQSARLWQPQPQAHHPDALPQHPHRHLPAGRRSRDGLLRRHPSAALPAVAAAVLLLHRRRAHPGQLQPVAHRPHRRAEPHLGRPRQRNSPPTRHPHQLAQRMARIHQDERGKPIGLRQCINPFYRPSRSG